MRIGVNKLNLQSMPAEPEAIWRLPADSDSVALPSCDKKFTWAAACPWLASKASGRPPKAEDAAAVLGTNLFSSDSTAKWRLCGKECGAARAAGDRLCPTGPQTAQQG